MEELVMKEVHESEELLSSSMVVQDLPLCEKEHFSETEESSDSEEGEDHFCTSETEESSYSGEDEETVLSRVIPRHLSLIMKKERSSNSQIAEEESESESEDDLLPLRKVVIRHLPPEMEKEKFFQLVSPLPPHNYKYFAKAGNSSKEKYNMPQLSTAYINFIHCEDALRFQKNFDGHIFTCSKGEKYKAIVEFASSQHVPKQKPMRNPFCGTIDDDPDYLKFLKSLEGKTTDMPNEVEVKEAVSKPTDPLVEFVNMQRRERIANGACYQPRRRNPRWQTKPRQWNNSRPMYNEYSNFHSPHFSKNTQATYCQPHPQMMENCQSIGTLDNKFPNFQSQCLFENVQARYKNDYENPYGSRSRFTVHL